MKNQKNSTLVLILLLHLGLYGQYSGNLICRQGKVSFFSYTAVENIEATNNQVVSIVDENSGEIAVQMLMRAFVFKKALMEEHFNESYVESDTYPKLTFSGKINDFDGVWETTAPKFVDGIMDFHGVQKTIALKISIENENNNLVLSGDFNVSIDDFDIKVPPLLVPNISKEIQVMFRFEYVPYEE
ncbi:YceI family protein [Muricauda sp. SCSIO 64092]|uniref:YceI family protein n=1 Tax=Allomuricauda sp. SCSIO 64092 TaxID=2908842 RepID=UPI001FF3FBFD|nr:YceI family protein [Muricauda sp. SCSIO 64092]UOY07468.1 YceI family protein [Muricauda sp. SCSIO 64092]